jgi:hypothetical protein
VGYKSVGDKIAGIVDVEDGENLEDLMKGNFKIVLGVDECTRVGISGIIIENFVISENIDGIKTD